ncbi:MAG: PSD1 domain-containing protein [Verrucomicrobia bacterium]|nr:PSD1 domain-containing protein [Verrucomicrobiota bacterium]
MGKITSLICVLAVAAVTVVVSGATKRPTRELTFEQDIRPVLKTHCFHCHGEGDKLKGDVDLRLRRFMDKHTDSGRVMVPGKPGESLLVKLIRAGEMPKGEKKLTEKEIALIEGWIARGAKTAGPEPAELPKGFYITEQERNFWSFRPITRPTVPKLKNAARVRTPVDTFVLEKLREQKLDFAPEADRLTLIRRVYFDLLGLPPTPEDVEQFLADKSADAYERLVDRVLASPRYGERWARRWLDVAGYADSNGFTESDSPRPHAWRYRDYVIRCFNEDRPFDQFIVEQLAGDELAGITTTNVATVLDNPRAIELLTATGFLRMAPDGTGDGPPDQNLARNQVVAETIKIVSSSLLGLTVGCAQCHDHRYDPISHVDYHRLRAIFEPAYDWKNWRNPSERLVSLYPPADRAKAEEIETEARKLSDVAEKLRKELLEKVFEKELAKLPEEIRETVKTARNTPRDKRTPEQVALFKQYPSADVQGALDLYDPEANKKVQAEQAKADKLRATKPPEPMIMALTEVPGKVPETFLFARGDHEQPKQKVEPGELEVLQSAGAVVASRPALRKEPVQFASLDSRPGLPANASPVARGLIPLNSPTLASSGRRLAYARWLTSGGHPLTARVLVNRFWLHHFGRGLVNTPGDFGQLGERPTHPELLDWLASEFTASGWKLKAFHRLILTSSTYRQSSRNDAALAADPDNRFYGRMKLRRLDAETLRDSILAVSGKLNLEAFGAAVPTAQDGAGRVVMGQQKTDSRGDPTIVEAIGEKEFRRSVYVERRRSFPLTVFDTFDAPVMSPNCDARVVTTVAPQSLMMLNDTFVLAESKHFAERLCRESPGNVRAQIQRAWNLAFNRTPSETELREGLFYLAEQGEAIRARQAALVEGKKSDKSVAQPDTQTLALASMCQALMSENRFLYVE